MGQLVGLNAKPKRANLNALSSITTAPANGEIILVSSDNSMDANGQGNFDCYIVGDGTTAANKLNLMYIDSTVYIDTEYQLSIQTNYFLDANSTSDTFGQLVSVNDVAYCVSDYIPVEEGEIWSFVAITGSGTSSVVNHAGYIFYDSAKTPIIGVPTVGNNAWSFKEYTIAIPNGVSYFRTSYAYGRNNNFIVKKKIDEILKNLYEENVITTQKNVSITSNSIIIANDDNNNYGNSISAGDSAYVSTDFINVEGGKSITYIALLGAGDSRAVGNAGAVFYDSNKLPIKGNITIASTRWEYGSVTLNIPDEAVYARLTIAYTYNATVYITSSVKNVCATKSELEDAVEKMSTITFDYTDNVQGWFITDGNEEKCTVSYDPNNSLLITLTKITNCPGCILTINCSELKDGESYTLHLKYTSTTTSSTGLYKFTANKNYVSYGGGKITQANDADYQFEFIYDSEYPIIGWFVNDFPNGTVFTISSCSIEIVETIAEAIQNSKSEDVALTDDTAMLKQLLFPQGSVLSLLHFSDIHGDDTAALKIRKYYDRYSDYIDDILNTGDTVVDTNADSLGFINNANLGVALMTIGNHDTWGNSEQSFVYNKFFTPYISSWGVTQPSNAAANSLMYWYKDYTSKGIRLIGIDCMYPTEAQFTWLTSTLNDAKNNNLSVVLASHYMPLNSSYNAHVLYHGDLPTFSALTDYGLTNAPQEMSNSFIQKVQDYIDGGGKFICWLCGHRHNDAIFYPDGYNEQLVITIDNAGTRVPNATGDRTGEYLYCANVVGIDANSKLIKLFRVGCKSDKWMRNINVLTYDYANKKVITNY